MKVKIKKLTDNARVPTQAHEKDFCYDVYATSCKEVEPGIWEYGLGLAFEIVRDPICLGEWKHQFEAEYHGLDQTSSMLFTPNIQKRHLCISKESFSNVKISIDFRPRSSIWKTGMILSNCEGTIDELYRGEVKAYFYEVIKGKEKYKVGDRIGQIKLGFTLPIEFEEVNELNTDTDRGTNGFGSSGK